jgi:ligand-binding sensor domain-containing protein
MKKMPIILLTFITALTTTLPFAVSSTSGATKERQTVIMETYDSSDGLIPSNVIQIYQDRKGDLWITTEEGVSRYDGKKFQNFTMNDSLPGYIVIAIAEDDKGNLWFGTKNGVSRYDGERFQNFTEQEGLIDNFVGAILKDHNGQLWFHTNKGVVRYDGERFHSVGSQELASMCESSQTIEEDQTGNLWFGTESNGVFRYDGKSFQQFTQKDGLIGDTILAIWEDSAGNLWFGSWGGVSRYDGKTFHNFIAGGNEGFPVSAVREILEDSSGNLWFTGHEGLCEYDGKQFKLYTVEDGLPINWTTTITEDVEENFWVGTQASGIVRLERNFQNLGKGKPIKDKYGNIWCSLSSGIVSKYDGRIFQPYLTQKDGVPKDASLQYIDASGNLWLQSPKGIWKYDGKRITPYLMTEDGMPEDASLDYIDSSGNLWLFGRFNQDVWMYNNKSVQHILTSSGQLQIYDYSLRLGEIQDQFRELLIDIETEPLWFDRRQIDREAFYNLKRICDELREIWVRLDQTLKIFDVLRGGSGNV